MAAHNLRKRWTHARNKHMDEGALRNVMMEVRDVAKPLGHLVHQLETAVDETVKWGKEQKAVVTAFVNDIAGIEKDITKNGAVFADTYL